MPSYLIKLTRLAMPTALKGPGSLSGTWASTFPKKDCQLPSAQRMVCHSLPSLVVPMTWRSPPAAEQLRPIKTPGLFDTWDLTSLKGCQVPSTEVSFPERLVYHKFLSLLLSPLVSVMT